MRVRVLIPFYCRGIKPPVGTILDLSDEEAEYWIRVQKAQPADATAAGQPETAAVRHPSAAAVLPSGKPKEPPGVLPEADLQEPRSTGRRKRTKRSRS